MSDRILKDIAEVQCWLKTFAEDEETEEGDICSLVDWLQEEDATLAEVLMLFAAGPPTWLHPTWSVDAALWRVLAKWCELTEPREMLVNIPFPAGSAPYHYDAFRYGAVMWPWWDKDAILNLYRSTWIGAGDGKSYVWLQARNRERHPAEAAAIDRELKRRILSLFPDVMWMLEAEFHLSELERTMAHDRGAGIVSAALRRWNRDGIILWDHTISPHQHSVEMLRCGPNSRRWPIEWEVWHDPGNQSMRYHASQTRPAPDWILSEPRENE